jgi:hypothetical protein
MNIYPYSVLLNADSATFPPGMAATIENDALLGKKTVRVRRVFPDGKVCISDTRLGHKDVFALARLCLDDCDKNSPEREVFKRLFADIM